MPWEVRPNSHLAAPFGAQVLAAALSGMTVTATAGQARGADGRVWHMPNRAVPEAGGSADCSGTARVGVDDTARGRGQDCVSTMAGLDGQRVVAVAEGMLALT